MKSFQDLIFLRRLNRWSFLSDPCNFSTFSSKISTVNEEGWTSEDSKYFGKCERVYLGASYSVVRVLLSVWVGGWVGDTLV